MRLRALITLLLALTAFAAPTALPALALADGDPGSDVLLDQNLFYGSDTGVTVPQQLSLDALLNATTAAGAPVRVAIIAHPDDLGTVTPLWQKPQTYAEYLGYELSDTYTGRLLIVMPDGLGVYWNANPEGAAKLAASLAPLEPGTALVSATRSAIYRIEAAAGVKKSALSGSKGATAGTSTKPANASAPTSASTTTKRPGGHRSPTGWFIALLVALALLYVGWRTGQLRKLRGVLGVMRLRGELSGVRVRPVALLPTLLLVIVVVALVINRGGGGGDTARALATNPHIDPGTSLGGRPAPNFTLTDQSGRQVSLSQYRGKAVILAFVDAECQTICPLTTQAMLDAKRDLGRAGDELQLLGVNANWKSTQIDDVLNYTELHGMVGSWQFGTGSVGQLERVWRAYHVDEKALVTKADNVIDHVAALYVIDPQGRERVVFTTYPSYASVPQLGQLLAQDVAKLLPSPHPKVSSHYSYAEAPETTPRQSRKLAELGGGHLRIGPGKPHLYLFFATWDQQTLPLAADLDKLNRYAEQAKRDGLPQLTAIDEGSVEPSSRAMPEFIAGLPKRLDYPVAIDSTGSVADGYQVEGEPWFVETNAAGKIVLFQEVYTQGWPRLATFEQELRQALVTKTAVRPTSLDGSPRPLAVLHAQGSKLLSGGQAALDARIKRLEAAGYPVVLNIWSSWCGPCQAEFGLFQKASLEYGKRVAFLGADNADSAANAQAFLNEHHVSYPSYATNDTSIEDVLVGGLQGTPTTVYLIHGLTPSYVLADPYESIGELQADIDEHALGRP